MPKLNQIVAVEKGLKSRTQTALTGIYHNLQKPPLYSGLSRKYTPVDDEGETFPPESTLVQQDVESNLRKAADVMTQLYNVVATKEEGNRHAVADVKADGQVVVEGATVPLLLFLEKQLTDIRTVISKAPVLDPSEEWHQNGSSVYRTEAVQTTRTRKVPRTLIRYEATDKHPAQTEVYMIDEIVGHWATTKFSGAIPSSRRDQLIARVDALIDAVKRAREEANSVEVEQRHVGEGLFGYLLQ